MGTSDVPASHPVGNWTGSTKTQPQLNDQPRPVAISRSPSQSGCDFSAEVERLQTDLGCHKRELHPFSPSWSDCKMPCMCVCVYIYIYYAHSPQMITSLWEHAFCNFQGWVRKQWLLSGIYIWCENMWAILCQQVQQLSPLRMKLPELTTKAPDFTPVCHTMHNALIIEQFNATEKGVHISL